MESVTEKQAASIKEIEKVLGIKFWGDTKREAWVFMKDNLPKAYKKLYNEYCRVLNDEPEARFNWAATPATNPDNVKLEFIERFELDFESQVHTIESLDDDIAMLKAYLNIF
jgi:hypothetical protein